MAAIRVENQLYLYQLLSREVGIGRQVMLSRVEEVLLADDIWPSDLGCTDVRELMERLNGFVRLTVFKRGRVYATVLAVPEWDAALEQAKKDEAKPAEKGGAKSWKRKRAKRSIKPMRPRPKGRPKAEPKSTEAPVLEVSTESGHTTAAESATEAEPVTEEKQTTEAEDEDELKAQPTLKTEPKPDPEPELTPEPEPELAPEPESEPSIRFTIVYDPYAKGEGEDTEHSETDRTKKDPPSQAKQAIPSWTAHEQLESSPTSQARFPEDFVAEVLVRNKELSSLYQMLPIDADPMVILDEDWRVARSTMSFWQKDGATIFPLRCLKDSSEEPVRVTMQRHGPTSSGKRWVVTSIDHVANASFEGLSVTGSEVMRELAQFAELGSWETLTQQLEQKIANTHVPLHSNELRDYLCVTFHRIMREKKFVEYEEGTRAAFDTGLLDDSANSVLMCFKERKGDIAWRFTGFFSPKEAQLGGEPPLPATYLKSLSNIALFAETNVLVSKALVRAHGTKAQRAIDAALQRARRDYRLGTPAYDPLANEVFLLLPIELPKGMTQALVLRPQEDGFVASALLPLEQAATHARIISFELPRWLA